MTDLSPTTSVMVDGQTVDGSLALHDRTFRGAWTLDAGVIVVDMDRARALHLEALRAARAPLLAALDVQYQRADEENDAEAKAEVIARKQVLRDITDDPRIAAAATPEQLKALTIDALTA